MNKQELIATAGAMVADGKGLLAMDESNTSRAGIESTNPEKERARKKMPYRVAAEKL